MGKVSDGRSGVRGCLKQGFGRKKSSYVSGKGQRTGRYRWDGDELFLPSRQTP